MTKQKTDNWPSIFVRIYLRNYAPLFLQLYQRNCMIPISLLFCLLVLSLFLLFSCEYLKKNFGKFFTFFLGGVAQVKYIYIKNYTTMRKQTNKTIRLTESDLNRVVKRVINEQYSNTDGMGYERAIFLYEQGVDYLESAMEIFEMSGEVPEELDNLFGGQGNENLSNLQREVKRLVRGM